MQAPGFELESGQVHVWLLELDAVQDSSILRRFRDILSPEERSRLERFVVEPPRHEYLVAHALTRLILGRYEGAEPAALSFVSNSFGRPELSASRLGLRFNLSHALGSGALVITRAWDIGVDLECDDRPIVPLEIAEHYFSPPEVDWLRRQPPSRQKSCFVDLWSLKEAYIKARGMGLSIPLNQFGVDLSDPDRPRLFLPPGHEDDRGEWKLFLARPATKYALSVAVRCGARAEPQLMPMRVASIASPLDQGPPAIESLQGH